MCVHRCVGLCVESVFLWEVSVCVVYVSVTVCISVGIVGVCLQGVLWVCVGLCIDCMCLGVVGVSLGVWVCVWGIGMSAGRCGRVSLVPVFGGDGWVCRCL